MRIFEKESLFKKLVMLLIVLVLISAIIPKASYAGTASVIGGKLLSPVCDLLLALGDGIMNIVQNAILGMEGDLGIDLTGSKKGWALLAGIVAGALVFIGAAILTGGISAIISSIGGVLGTILTTVASAGIVTTIVNTATLAGAVFTGLIVAHAVAGSNLPDITMLPLFGVGPEEIFEGRLLVFDIDFFNPKQVYAKFENETTPIKIQDYNTYMSNNPDAKVEKYYYEKGGEQIQTSKQNTAMQLSSTISKWYYVIRNTAIIIMMLIIVYIGIRMMLSSVASDKSKYKKMFFDWLVSMCLVFVLHYIMVFAVSVNQNIIDIIKASTENNTSIYVISFNDMKKSRKKGFIQSLYEQTEGEYNENYIDKDGNSFMDSSDDPTKKVDDIEGFVWYTNLIGMIRMSAQNQDGRTEYVGYAIAYLVLVFYTIFFSFTYLKRVLYMAFLTIIAPLVAMTYSIDKINDGKAQAFNMWFKEYIFNLLIQPMHLLLFTVFISMAYELAETNVVYTLVAIGFMIPAEKLVRKMFGFEKAQTPGVLGGAAGATLTMQALKGLAGFAGKGHGGKNGSNPVGKLDKSSTEDSRGANSGTSLAGLFDNDSVGEDNTDSGSMPLPSGGFGNPPTNNSGYSLGGASASDANIGGDEDPIARMQRENLEERLADGQITPDELTPEQRAMLGLGAGVAASTMAENPSIRMQREDLEERLADGQITPDELSDEERTLLGMNNDNNNSQEESQQGEGNRMLEESRRRQQEEEMNRRRQLQEEEERRKKADKKRKNKARVKAVGRTIRSGVKPVIKSGTRLTGTILGAGIGLGVGITSGDMSKVVQYTGLGISAGSSIGTGITKGLKEPEKMQDIVDKYKKERYGDKYSSQHKKELDNKFMKDKEARKEYEEAFSTELDGLGRKEKKEKLDSIMKDAVKYREKGVTDNKLICKAMKLDDNRTSKESIGAAMLANKSKDIKEMKEYQNDLVGVWGRERTDRITKNAKKLNGWR